MIGEKTMEKQIYNKENGLHYTLGEDGYYYPNLALPEQKYSIGRFGRMHLDYLKNHRKIVYTRLLVTGKLNNYIHDIDVQAQEQYETLIKQYAKAQGVTEQLKAENQLEWVGRMNNIKACAEEVILKEIVYK